MSILSNNLSPGIFNNPCFIVLLWKRINDTEKIRSQELQTRNESIFINISLSARSGTTVPNFFRFFFANL